MSEVHRVIVQAIQKHEPGATVQQKSSYVQSSGGNVYFAKVGSPREVDQFVGEAEALKAMHIAAPGIAPRLIECGIMNKETVDKDSDTGRPYFVSEYKMMTSLTDASAKILAKRLATELHAYKSTQGFGFPVPTFCGRTKQDNGWYDSWEACYDALIGGLLNKLEVQGGYEDLCRKGKQVRARFGIADLLTRTPNLSSNRIIPALLGPLVIQPVLLHGDLWVRRT